MSAKRALPEDPDQGNHVEPDRPRVVANRYRLTSLLETARKAARAARFYKDDAPRASREEAEAKSPSALAAPELRSETMQETSPNQAARFSALLEAGQALAAAQSVPAVYAAVEAVGAELLGAERCHVVEIDSDDFDNPVAVSGEHLEDLSSSAVAEAVHAGTVVTRGPSDERGLPNSTVPADVNSLLCAPIHRDGQVVACLYATHRQLGGAFGDVERQIATFLATLAGATLEHVSGSATRFRALIENSSDITAMTDRNLVIQYVSPSVKAIHGWSPEDLVGHHGAVHAHPDDIDQAARILGPAMDSPGSKVRYEIRIQNKDASWRHVEVTCTNRLQDPGVQALVFNVHDVTEYRETEQRLARVTERFRLAFNNAPIGVALVDIGANNMGRFLLANRALAGMLGRSKEELEGSRVGDVRVDELSLEEESERLRQLLDRGDSFHYEDRYLHADGHRLWLNVHASAVRNDNGEADYMIVHFEDITEQKQRDETLKQQAFTDPLTRLDNRWLFLDRLPKSLARARRRGTHLAVFYLDIDNFKVINDSHGHSAGDLVLREVAARLRSVTRTQDILARLGGDEFVLVVDDLEAIDELHSIASRMEEVLHPSIEAAPDIHVTVTASIGVTIAGVEDDGQSLLRDADIALYRAKDRGKARFEVFGEQLRMRALERERSERDLRDAMDSGRMVLYYQTMVRLRDRCTDGVEALVRYRSDAGLVPPMQFMKVAEETGLIVPLGRWVLGESCRTLPALRKATGNPDLHVGVNVSPRQLVDTSFARTVAQTIETAGLQPGSVVLEITEHALIDMVESVRPCLEELRRIGCRIGIDDFGTGYSSMVFLTRLPLDFLKIDQTFVRGLGVRSEDEAIVKGLINLSSSLGLLTVAEGVETPQQAEALEAFGCGGAQGYLFAPPLPLEQVK